MSGLDTISFFTREARKLYILIYLIYLSISLTREEDFFFSCGGTVFAGEERFFIGGALSSVISLFVPDFIRENRVF